MRCDGARRTHARQVMAARSQYRVRIRTKPRNYEGAVPDGTNRGGCLRVSPRAAGSETRTAAAMDRSFGILPAAAPLALHHAPQPIFRVSSPTVPSRSKPSHTCVSVEHVTAAAFHAHQDDTDGTVRSHRGRAPAGARQGNLDFFIYYFLLFLLKRFGFIFKLT